MRIAHVAEPGGLRKIVLHHLTDLHAGAPDFDEHALRQRIDLIHRDPRARWTMGGDGGELIKPHDKRYSVTAIHPRYRQAPDIRLETREHLVELFQPIAAKCWGWCDGNHERALDEYHGGRFGVETCTLLGVEQRWLGYRGFVHVDIFATKTARLPVLIDLQHGWQTGRLKGAPHVQAERELGMTDADIVLRGHNHQPMAHQFVTLGVNHGGSQQVRRRTRTVINGGTWRRGYRDGLDPPDPKQLGRVEGDLWGETKGFRAESVGGPVLILTVRHPSIRWEAGQKLDKRPLVVEHLVLEGEITEDALNLGE